MSGFAQPRFAGRAAIVTGAGSRIGRATALRLAREGARVVASDISKEPLEALAADFGALQGAIVNVSSEAGFRGRLCGLEGRGQQPDQEHRALPPGPRDPLQRRRPGASPGWRPTTPATSTAPSSPSAAAGRRAEAAATVSSPFFLTNRIANPVLRRLLRTRVGRLGRHLAVVRYRGRRTGLAHELVVQYVRDGSTVWIAVGWPERKTWWRNLRAPAPVELWFAGGHHTATAVVVDGATDPAQAAAGLTAYRAAMGGAPAIRTAAERTVLVRAELAAGAPRADS